MLALTEYSNSCKYIQTVLTLHTYPALKGPCSTPHSTVYLGPALESLDCADVSSHIVPRSPRHVWPSCLPVVSPFIGDMNEQIRTILLIIATSTSPPLCSAFFSLKSCVSFSLNRIGQVHGRDGRTLVHMCVCHSRSPQLARTRTHSTSFIHWNLTGALPAALRAYTKASHT